MGMISMVVGGTTDTSARFVAKVDTGPVAIAYDTDPGMSSPTTSSSVAVDAQGVATVEVTGLTANTRYYWQVVDNGTRDTSTTGTFRTDPPFGQAASFTIALAGDAGQSPAVPGSGSELVPDRISNHPVFDTIRDLAVAGDWLRFVHLGDLHYYDFGTTTTDNLTNRRRSYDDILTQPRQHHLYREVPWVYTWDDHDYGGNNADGTYANKSIAQTVYRERVPHYDLDDADAIYQSFQIGRVLFAVLDCRSNRSPNGNTDNSSKTMLGAAQKTWLDGLLDATSAQFLVVVSSSQWLGTTAGGDGWNSFTTERTELINLFDSHGFLSRMCIVCADAHYLAIDSGTNPAGGGIPVFQFAGLDAEPSDDNSARFDTGTSRGARGQFGTLRFDDNGTDIAVTGTGWRNGQPLIWHTFNTGPSSATPRRGSPSHVLAL